jgi:hypothetical protein
LTAAEAAAAAAPDQEVSAAWAKPLARLASSSPPPQDDQPEQAAQAAQEEVRVALAGHVPDAVHRVLGRLGHPQAAPEGQGQADGQGHPAAPQAAAVHLAPDLVADHRELGHRRVDDAPAQVRAALEHEPDHRDRHQQQREQREEAVVGEQGGVPAGLVVAELLDHRHREAQPGPPLLVVVDGPE